MARIERHRAGRAEVNVSQTEDQIAGVEQNVAYLFASAQAVDALDEIDVVRQPGRRSAHRLLIAIHRAQRG